MGSNGQYADTTAGLKRLAGRSLLAVGSGLAKGAGLVATAAARGVSALTSDAGDREAVLSLKFALAEWTDDAGAGDGAAVASGAPPALRRLPVLLVGLDSGFQVRICATNYLPWLAAARTGRTADVIESQLLTSRVPLLRCAFSPAGHLPLLPPLSCSCQHCRHTVLRAPLRPAGVAAGWLQPS